MSRKQNNKRGRGGQTRGQSRPQGIWVQPEYVEEIPFAPYQQSNRFFVSANYKGQNPLPAYQRNKPNNRKRGGKRKNNNNNNKPKQEEVLEADNHLDYDIDRNMRKCILPNLGDYDNVRVTSINIKPTNFLRIVTDGNKTDAVVLEISNIIYRTKITRNKRGRSRQLIIGGIFSVCELNSTGKIEYAMADICNYNFGKNPRLIKHEYKNGVRKTVTLPIDFGGAFSVMQALTNKCTIIVNRMTHEICEVHIPESELPYQIMDKDAEKGNTISSKHLKDNANFQTKATDKDAIQLEENANYFVTATFLTTIGNVTIMPSRSPRKVRFFDRTNRNIWLWDPIIPMPTPGTVGKFAVKDDRLIFVVSNSSWDKHLKINIESVYQEGQSVGSERTTDYSIASSGMNFISVLASERYESQILDNDN